MKEKYRLTTACLSLVILTLAFVVGSDKELSRICIPLAFAAGALLYGTGASYNRRANRKTAGRLQGLCALLFLAAFVFSVLRMGGIA